MAKKRKGDWFQTHSGIKFYPLDPYPEDIRIEDVAHSLARICRFGGHVKETPYSVAQHCYHCSFLVSEEIELEALMHDGPEAYLGDVVTPLKRGLSEYREIEERLERIFCEVFSLKFRPPEVKAADLKMLATERRDLLAVVVPWEKEFEPMKKKISPMTYDEAEKTFLKRFYELQKKRNVV